MAIAGAISYATITQMLFVSSINPTNWMSRAAHTVPVRSHAAG